MQLYVWHNALTDATPGVMFAMATSADEARQLILAQIQEDWQRLTIEQDIAVAPTVYDAPVGFFVFGGG